jgi:hypothetical protein
MISVQTKFAPNDHDHFWNLTPSEVEECASYWLKFAVSFDNFQDVADNYAISKFLYEWYKYLISSATGSTFSVLDEFIGHPNLDSFYSHGLLPPESLAKLLFIDEGLLSHAKSLAYGKNPFQGSKLARVKIKFLRKALAIHELKLNSI